MEFALATKKKSYKKEFILSLGGSLIVPNGGIDIKFLQTFNRFIRKKVAQGCRFFIVCGGGMTTRHYQAAAKAVLGREITNEDMDWLGIHSTRLNAHLMRTIFRDIAYDHIIKHYDLIDKKAVHPVVLCSGWRPGWSTDYDAVLLAQDYGIKYVINLSNIKMVYDKDPKKYENAKPIQKMHWNDLISIIGKKWVPGLNAPFDPIASQLAKSLGLEVIICDGKNLKNLDNILEDRQFIGTVIE
jgi:uridylate kinase